VKRKLLTAVLVITVLGFSLASVLLQTNLALLHDDRSLTITFLQRLSGMLIIGLLFCQIILIEKYRKLNILFTVIILILILIHPFLAVYFKKIIFGKLNIFYPFTDMCFLCNPPELIITLGRLAFWFYVAAVGAVILKTYPWFKENWQKVHALIYFAFFYASAHMFLIGSDARKAPYLYFFIVLIGVVLIKGVRKLRN